MSEARYPDPLAQEFTRFEHTFRQVHRTKNACVYEVKPVCGCSIAYEVVKPTVSSQRCIDGTWSPCAPYEVYPSSEQWGRRAWTFTNKQTAMEKCEML